MKQNILVYACGISKSVMRRGERRHAVSIFCCYVGVVLIDVKEGCLLAKRR